MKRIILNILLIGVSASLIAQNPATSQSQSDTTHYDQYGQKKVDPPREDDSRYQSDRPRADQKDSHQSIDSASPAGSDKGSSVPAKRQYNKSINRKKNKSQGNSDGPPTGSSNEKWHSLSNW